eukprot:226875-Amphidinium_carterae.2
MNYNHPINDRVMTSVDAEGARPPSSTILYIQTQEDRVQGIKRGPHMLQKPSRQCESISAVASPHTSKAR